MKRIAIIGSRTINNYEALKELLAGVQADQVVSGGAKGVDSLAARWAEENRAALIVARPDYKGTANKRYAPLLRNMAIVELAQVVYALWDGKSSGTKWAIDYALGKGKEVHIKTLGNPAQTSLF